MITNGKRVLLVDDDPQVLLALERELEEAFVCTVASSYEDAFNALVLRYDLCSVVTDLNLGPGPDGIDFLVQVERWNPWLPRVLCSGGPETSRVTEAMRSGLVQRFLPKPWDAGAVLAVVQQLSAPETMPMKELVQVDPIDP